MTWGEFTTQAAALGADVAPDMLERLKAFEDRLYEANQTANLTRVPRELARTRHFLDSLSLVPLIPQASSVIDIGTGAGFPGVPLAIVRPDLQVTLLDAASKEMRFLESLADIVSVGFILGRAEEIARDTAFRERYDVATGRAVAPLAAQAEISAPFVRIGGLFLPQRAAGEVLADFNEIGIALRESRLVEIGGVARIIGLYEKIAATPSRFPRSWAAIKKRGG